MSLSTGVFLFNQPKGERSRCYQGSWTKDEDLFARLPCLKIKRESGLNAQIAVNHKEIPLSDNVERTGHCVRYLRKKVSPQYIFMQVPVKINFSVAKEICFFKNEFFVNRKDLLKGGTRLCLLL